MVQDGEMDAGNLLSFVIYTVMIGGAIASLGTLYTTIASALGATERVKEILDRDAELPVQNYRDKLRLKGDITFKNVEFSVGVSHSPANGGQTSAFRTALPKAAGPRSAQLEPSLNGKSWG